MARVSTGQEKVDDYYKLLGLKPDASFDEIKTTYRRLALEFHPDQARGGMDDQEVTTIFSKVAQAYTVLSEPVTRALYDISCGYVKDSEAERRRVNTMKRAEAEKQVELRESTVARIIEEEREQNGLIILEAMYGDISLGNVDSASAAGKCIDVTIPLQCQVKSSALIVHGGGSKAWLEGFYDPNDNKVENLLYVRYLFLGHLHECIISDMEELCLPLQEHCVQEDVSEDGLEDETDSDDEEGASDDGMSRLRRAEAKDRKAAEKAKKKAAVAKSAVKSKLQAQQELAAVKAKRRKRLVLGMGAAAVILGFYLAHKYKLIDLRKITAEIAPKLTPVYVAAVACRTKAVEVAAKYDIPAKLEALMATVEVTAKPWIEAIRSK